MVFIEIRGRVYIREKFNFDYINMVVILLFWNIKMVIVVMLCEKVKGLFIVLEF